MSFFGMGRPQPSSEEKIAMMENEIIAMSDLHNRLSKICSRKCIPTDYREGEINKGESVCLDRCTAKFFEAYMKTNELMQQYGQQMQSGGKIGGLK
ncbi:hypothetical protein SAPIO_CDS1358 [Scedosporium apiospermum]|uniref:Mitochondrial import inner membrane translocase subunit n=1 Tax=Pseudallescheria apiosperma TaxID=563466 RepID=A0A084GF53_PSEDA|nr:uncharacterized protein SAPIO_CDS1358 [Scedosporium apiospermum]KEZ45965.1 hypothetical protein SAPIO_CDS1358 [Scedosporium apiospermum]